MIKLTKLLLNLTKMWLKRIKNFLKKPKPKKPRKKRKTRPKPKLIIRKCTQLPLKLEKAISNPIMEPKYKNKWESWQTFNPAAIYLNNNKTMK